MEVAHASFGLVRGDDKGVGSAEGAESCAGDRRDVTCHRWKPDGNFRLPIIPALGASGTNYDVWNALWWRAVTAAYNFCRTVVFNPLTLAGPEGLGSLKPKKREAPRTVVGYLLTYQLASCIRNRTSGTSILQSLTLSGVLQSLSSDSPLTRVDLYDIDNHGDILHMAVET